MGREPPSVGERKDASMGSRFPVGLPHCLTPGVLWQSYSSAEAEYSSGYYTPDRGEPKKSLKGGVVLCPEKGPEPRGLEK